MRTTRRICGNRCVRGGEDPVDEEIVEFDRKRAGKTMSNADWGSPVDPDARVKDEATKLADEAENVVDSGSERG